MFEHSVWCDTCRGAHRVCALCGQMVSYDPLTKLTMDAHLSSHHYCKDSEPYRARTRAMAEYYARQDRQMISDCPNCPDKLVFRYAGEPTLYDDVEGQIVHNCAVPMPMPAARSTAPDDRPRPPLRVVGMEIPGDS